MDEAFENAMALIRMASNPEAAQAALEQITRTQESIAAERSQLEEDRDAIIASAKAAANDIVAESRAEANAIVDQAQQQADRMLADATRFRDEAREMLDTERSTKAENETLKEELQQKLAEVESLRSEYTRRTDSLKAAMG